MRAARLTYVLSAILFYAVCGCVVVGALGLLASSDWSAVLGFTLLGMVPGAALGVTGFLVGSGQMGLAGVYVLYCFIGVLGVGVVSTLKAAFLAFL